MKSLLEKLKSLDKKVYIIAAVALVAVIAVVVALVIGLSNNDNSNIEDPDDTGLYFETSKGDKDTDADEETTGESETEADTEAETEVETDVETDAETETETDVETNPHVQTAPVTKPVTTPNTTTPPSSETPSSSSNDTTAKEPVVTNPVGNEILGAGSASEPYMEIPASDMTVTTVNIPAGKSLHYGIYRVGGMILTINNPNAYVVYGGNRYNANNGVVYIEIENALASDAIMFEIGNNGSASASFKLVFTNPTGSYSNPTIVNTMGSDVKVNLEEGNDVGHYFKYYAEKNGVIRFYMTASADSIILVTNNRNSAQRTSEADAKTDEQGRTYIEVEVNQGDELIINVGAKPNKRGKYPATDITWSGKFA